MHVRCPFIAFLLHKTAADIKVMKISLKKSMCNIAVLTTRLYQYPIVEILYFTEVNSPPLPPPKKNLNICLCTTFGIPLLLCFVLFYSYKIGFALFSQTIKQLSLGMYCHFFPTFKLWIIKWLFWRKNTLARLVDMS